MLSQVLIGGILPPGGSSRWSAWFCSVASQALLELPDHVAASIELAQFVAADVDSLA